MFFALQSYPTDDYAKDHEIYSNYQKFIAGEVDELKLTESDNIQLNDEHLPRFRPKGVGGDPEFIDTSRDGDEPVTRTYKYDNMSPKSLTHFQTNFMTEYWKGIQSDHELYEQNIFTKAFHQLLA